MASRTEFNRENAKKVIVTYTNTGRDNKNYTTRRRGMAVKIIFGDPGDSPSLCK